jgi:hypothetical protein
VKEKLSRNFFNHKI